MSTWFTIGVLGIFAILNVLAFFVMLYQVWAGIPGQLKYVNLILNPVATVSCIYVARHLWRGT